VEVEDEKIEEAPQYNNYNSNKNDEVRVEQRADSLEREIYRNNSEEFED